MAYTYKKRVNTDSKHSSGFPGGDPFSKNPSTGGNCTWWAWGRFKEVYKLATGKSLSWTSGSGNACAFYRIMGNHGYKTGQTPKPGAIICWGYNGASEGNPGHVAFVEQVYKNGDIEISQSGWSSGPLANRKITKSSGYKFGYNNDHFNGFIYNKVEFTNPDGTVVSVGSADHPRSWYINKYGNEAKVYFALRDENFSHTASCALMGNIKQESGFNPASVNSIGATGICQWLNTRCKNMKNYKSGESSWKSITHQVKFIKYESKKSYKSSVYDVLVNSKKTLKEMTFAVLRYYETPTTDPKGLDREMGNRYPPAQTYDKRYKNAYGGGGSGSDDISEGAQAVVDMKKRSSQLYSSAGYSWGKPQKEDNSEPESEKRLRENTKALKNFLTNIQVKNPSNPTLTVPDYIKLKASTPGDKLVRNASSVLSIAQAMVEAPFVEADFNGIKIGTVKNSVDDFPNHISKLEIDKINGEINKYTLNVVHQIRPGEDPNLFDRIISSTRYNKISLRYGDYMSNMVYSDEKIIITNVVMSRDYTNNRISYTIYGTSAGEFVSSCKFNFSTKFDKPSNVINNLLYNNKSTSSLLLEAFPGMKNKTLVNSNNLIPNNDCILELDSQVNLSPLEYINYLVSCMSNSSNPSNSTIRNSSYYITYENDFDNKMGGSYFKITEVKPNNISNTYSNNIYEITVGYPDNNYVMGFSVNNESAWSLLYNNSSIASEYIYSIDSEGNRVKQYSPNLMSSSEPLNEIQKNWWTNMTQFPINATVTLKGLMKPSMLMDYIIINTVFYGQKHITSGIYTLTGQIDTLSGDGFRSTLHLTRIGAN